MAIKSKNKKILYLIDGMPLVYRAYYALITSPLFTSSGFNSSAVYGYVNTLLQIIDEVKSNHIVVVFDVSLLSCPNKNPKCFFACFCCV